LGRKIVLNYNSDSDFNPRYDIDYLVVDGSGFSFNDLYPIKFLRGEEVRKVSSHVKVVFIIGIIKGKKRFIMQCNTGKPYASEVKLLKEVIEDLDIKARYFIGDKCYDCIEIIKAICKKRINPAIEVKETFRMKVKDKYRLKSKINASKKRIYKNRNSVEAVFGNIKQKLSSHIFVKNIDIAERFAYIRAIIFNLCVYAEIEEKKKKKKRRKFKLFIIFIFPKIEDKKFYTLIFHLFTLFLKFRTAPKKY